MLRSLALAPQVFGDTHLKVARGLRNAAALCRAQGKYESAIELGREALDMTTALVGEEHPEVVPCLKSLALSHQSHHNSIMAYALLQQATEILSSFLGRDHPETKANLALLDEWQRTVQK